MKRDKRRRTRGRKTTRRTTPRRPPAPGDRAAPEYAGRGDGPGADTSVSAVLERAFAAHQAGDLQEAVRLYHRVLAMQPSHADALNLCGVATFQSGDAESAVKMLRAVVGLQPDHVDALNNLGNVLKASEKLDEAEAAYRRALTVKPDYADAHYNLGIVLEARARPDAAEAAYRRALDISPAFAGAHFNLANVLKALSRLDEAVDAYGRALDITPDHADAHNNLGNTLYELGRMDEAESAYRCALVFKSDHADAHYNLGIVLQETGRHDDAIAAYRRALRVEPEYVPVHVNLGYALQELDKLDEAKAAYRRAIALSPDYAQAHVNLADTQLQNGDARAAVAACDAYLRGHPGDTAVLAFKALALDEAGEREAARTLVDFDRFLRPTPLPAPDGFDTVADFNTALAHHVCTHPTLMHAPTSHATRLGKHSGELLVEPKGPIAALESLIRDAVEDYRRALPANPAHPFLADPPERLGLSIWGVVLEGQGHQIPHIHPSAWLSGVYYAKVPDEVRASGHSRAGWIEFGRPPEHFHCTVTPEVKAVRPEEGLLLLFPSYFYHGTVPFEAAEPRISIAFDVLPED